MPLGVRQRQDIADDSFTTEKAEPEVAIYQKDTDHVDRIGCMKDFDRFMKCQEKLLERGIVNSNFGLTEKLAA